MRKQVVGALALVALLASARAVEATPFTVTSPINGGTALPAGVTAVGGLVLDLVGLNGTRVVSQLAASSLFVGNFLGPNPLVIGTQTGFAPAVTSALGGGLAQLALRVSLFDGDSAAGNFDFNDNTLALNGFTMGNWSAVATQNTNATGTTAISSSTGFRDNILDTGFFYSTNGAFLLNVYNSLLATQQVIFQLNDVDAGDQFYDFTQGVDGGLINIGQGPVVTPGASETPEPTSMLLLGSGLAMMARRRYRRRQS